MTQQHEPLTADHVRILESFSQDTGAFRLTNKQAADLAAACAAAVKMNEALAASLAKTGSAA